MANADFVKAFVESNPEAGAGFYKILEKLNNEERDRLVNILMKLSESVFVTFKLVHDLNKITKKKKLDIDKVFDINRICSLYYTFDKEGVFDKEVKY